MIIDVNILFIKYLCKKTLELDGIVNQIFKKSLLQYVPEASKDNLVIYSGKKKFIDKVKEILGEEMGYDLRRNTFRFVN